MNGCYFIGEPGIGKSTLVSALTAGSNPEWRPKPFMHGIYRDDTGVTLAAQIGGPDEKYPGTDRLSMSVGPKAIDWLAQAPAPFVFGEGDRLASDGFFGAMDEWCDEWTLVVMNARPDVAAARRIARGSTQNAGWLKGRRTKFLRLAGDWRDRALVLDATAPTEELTDEVRASGLFAWTGLTV
jgi:hypothetical protein